MRVQKSVFLCKTGLKDADLNSITEISIAIKVACMPACASCARHVYPKLRSYINSRIGSSETYIAADATTTSSGNPVNNDMGLPQRFRYWGLRNWRSSNAMGLLELLMSKHNPLTASHLVISAFLMKRMLVKLRSKCESHSEARSKKYSSLNKR